MSTLVIIAHPDISNSTVNKHWRDALSKIGESVTVHEIYWYSSPPLMKQYLDEVFTHGWAYGSKGDALKGKNIGLAISIGSIAEAYTPEGNVKFTIDELVSPMIATTRFVSANYVGAHKLYSAFTIAPSQLEENTQDYLNFIQSLNK